MEPKNEAKNVPKENLNPSKNVPKDPISSQLAPNGPKRAISEAKLNKKGVNWKRPNTQNVNLMPQRRPQMSQMSQREKSQKEREDKEREEEEAEMERLEQIARENREKYAQLVAKKRAEREAMEKEKKEKALMMRKARNAERRRQRMSQNRDCGPSSPSHSPLNDVPNVPKCPKVMDGKRSKLSQKRQQLGPNGAVKGGSEVNKGPISPKNPKSTSLEPPSEPKMSQKEASKHAPSTPNAPRRAKNVPKSATEKAQLEVSQKIERPTLPSVTPKNTQLATKTPRNAPIESEMSQKTPINTPKNVPKNVPNPKKVQKVGKNVPKMDNWGNVVSPRPKFRIVNGIDVRKMGEEERLRRAGVNVPNVPQMSQIGRSGGKGKGSNSPNIQKSGALQSVSQFKTGCSVEIMSQKSSGVVSQPNKHGHTLKEHRTRSNVSSPIHTLSKVNGSKRGARAVPKGKVGQAGRRQNNNITMPPPPTVSPLPKPRPAIVKLPQLTPKPTLPSYLGETKEDRLIAIDKYFGALNEWRIENNLPSKVYSASKLGTGVITANILKQRRMEEDMREGRNQVTELECPSMARQAPRLLMHTHNLIRWRLAESRKMTRRGGMLFSRPEGSRNGDLTSGFTNFGNNDPMTLGQLSLNPSSARPVSSSLTHILKSQTGLVRDNKDVLTINEALFKGRYPAEERYVIPRLAPSGHLGPSQNKNDDPTPIHQHNNPPPLHSTNPQNEGAGKRTSKTVGLDKSKLQVESGSEEEDNKQTEATENQCSDSAF